jgi:hypothetical protein
MQVEHKLSYRLEAEDLVLELADRTGLSVAKSLGGFLHGADHWRRAAEEDLDVAGGGRKTFLKEYQLVDLTCY